MKDKAQKKMLGTTLQEFELVPITDPAELAAMERRRKANEKALRAAEKAYDAALRKASQRKPRKRK